MTDHLETPQSPVRRRPRKLSIAALVATGALAVTIPTAAAVANGGAGDGGSSGAPTSQSDGSAGGTFLPVQDPAPGSERDRDCPRDGNGQEQSS